MHVYPVRGRRGFFVTDTSLEEEDEAEEDRPSVVESAPPEPKPSQQNRHPPVLVHYVLLLLASILFDNASTLLGPGTVLTGQDGVQVVTTQTMIVPAATPPQFGEASASAQAVSAGAVDNIPAYDIALALSSDLTVKSLAPFSGGQDARDYKVVAQRDIDTGATILTGQVSANMTAALHEQLHAGEALVPVPCAPSVTTDHAVGEEASHIHVTVALSSTAVAYESQVLQTQASGVVKTQALTTIGQGYRLRSPVQVHVAQAIVRASIAISFRAVGIWLPLLDVLHIQRLVAGQPRAVELRLLEVLPGVSHVTLSGIADNELLAKDTDHLHMLIVEETAA